MRYTSNSRYVNYKRAASGAPLLSDGAPAEEECEACGSIEWDRITDRTSPGASFNRCHHCGNEWEPRDA
jgi:hypothetical protein